MAHVSIRDVTKRFGKVEVIHGIDLEIADGELVVLVGPSGCGKSTTLRMIAGLEEITSGEIAIAERVVNNVEPKDRNIAMVFQNYAIYPHMSVYRNIGFGLRSARLDKMERDRRIREAAAILDLTGLLDRRPAQLSGGQRQRVAIGRAMVRDPAVFLFDEPLSNLDAQLRAQMRLEIKKLHQRLGSTIVFVTHDQIEAMTLADRIVIMRDGHIQQVGSPTDVYLSPHNVFVARFIGSPSMNMLAGRTVGSSDGMARLDVEGLGSLAVPADGLDPGRPVTVGVRPDDLVVVSEADAGADGAVLVTGDVQVIEPLGPDTLVYASIGGQEVVATASGRNPPAVGTTVTMRLKPEDIHVFDAETEQALT